MGAKVLHAIICDRATRDNISGKVTCLGMSPRLMVDQLPHNASFSLVAWLSGVDEATNDFTIVVANRNGAVIGTKEHYKVTIQSGDEPAELMFHFNQFVFQTTDDAYTIEIRQGATSLLKKTIAVVKAPRIRPFNPVGDKGYVAL